MGTTDPAPAPPADVALPELAARLEELRVWAGSPSFTRLARDVQELRRRRGMPAAEARTARSTVYDCFRPGRRRLDTDLVLDIVEALAPGGHARDLWRAAVRRAVATAALRSPEVTVRTPGPQPTSGPFVGREDVIEQLAGSTDNAAVVGLAGIGKTAVIEEVARRLLEAGSFELCLRVNLDGFDPERAPLDPDLVMDSLLSRLIEGPAPRTRRLEAYATACERPVLLLLDNAAHPDQVRTLLPSADSPSRALVTSRISMDLPDTNQVHLKGLSTTESVELLALAAGVDVTPSEADAWRQLAEAAAGLPLAVKLTSGRIAARPDWSMTDHVEAHRQRLAVLHLEDGLAAALQTSYDGLPESGQTLLRLIAQAPVSTIDRGWAAALLGPGHDADEAFDSLLTAHLLQPTTSGLVGLHDLVRVFARRRALDVDPPSRIADASRRLLDHAVAHITAAVALVYPSAPPAWFWLEEPPVPLPGGPATEEAAVEWLTTHRAGAVELAGWAAVHHLDRSLCHLEGPLAMTLWDQGELDAAAALATSALVAARRLDDDRSAAFLQRHLAQSLIGVGRLQEALEAAEAAVEGHAGVDDPDGEALSRVALAKILRDLGQTEAAVAQTEQAIAHFAINPERGEHVAALRFDLADYHYQQDRPDLAEPVLEVVIDHSSAHGWPVWEMWARVLLSVVLVELGRPEPGPAHLARAMEIARARDNIRALALCQANLVLVLQALGSSEACLAAGREALAMAEELALHEVDLVVHEQIGRAAVLGGRTEQARHHLTLLRDMATAVGDHVAEREAVRWLAALDQSE